MLIFRLRNKIHLQSKIDFIGAQLPQFMALKKLCSLSLWFVSLFFCLSNVTIFFFNTLVEKIFTQLKQVIGAQLINNNKKNNNNRKGKLIFIGFYCITIIMLLLLLLMLLFSIVVSSRHSWQQNKENKSQQEEKFLHANKKFTFWRLFKLFEVHGAH